MTRDERGSATLFLLVLMAGLLLMAALVTDGAGKMRAARLATLSASEAARAASQELGAQVVAGGAGRVDTAAGAAAARSYLSAAGVRGRVSVAGSSVHVSTAVAWAPTFFPGAASTMTGDATATARRT